MTIRRRLTLSFLTILALFGLNLVIYFWGNHRRQSSLEDLRSAVRRQLLISSARQNLDNIQKQISLLSQGVNDTNDGGARLEEIAQFTAQLETVTSQIHELQDLSRPAERASVASLVQVYASLRSSWSICYANFGVKQSTAIAELAIHADPLAHRSLAAKTGSEILGRYAWDCLNAVALPNQAST